MSDHSRRSKSLTGPILLIGLGIFLLLLNLDILPQANVNLLLRFWPLVLLFIGLNILFKQVGGALGTLLQGILGLAVLGTVVFLLFFAQNVPALAPYVGESFRSNAELQIEEVAFPAEDVETAKVRIDFSSFDADVFALEDSNNLIEGTIAYYGELIFDASELAGEATVNLDTRRTQNDFYLFYWDSPNSNDDDTTWQVGLSPKVEMDLTLDLSSGAVELDLSKLMLSAIDIDGSSGTSVILLPDGDYEARFESGSGETRIVFPSEGQQEFTIDGGSGALRLVLPGDMEAMIEIVSDGSGSFSPGQRFEQIEEGDDNGEGVWVTQGYERGMSDSVEITLEIGSGSVRVVEP